MTPKNNLFISILAFLLIVNLLVLGDINQFYIRAILGFIFIITIPGLLIMLCLKIRHINFWEYLVYTIGLSVAFIMFAGLFVNWTLPFLHITDKPLSLYPIIICFDIFLLIMGFVAYKRNKDLKFKPKFPKFTILDKIFIVIPMLFPFMAVIGAFLLNNHGTNIITMIMLGAIAVYVFLVVLFRDKLNENVFPWALWMIGLSLLLMFSMRSWYVDGVDTNLEFSIFQLTKEKAFWAVSNFKDAYNAMLSVTILPNILLFFCKVNAQYIQKLFFSIIFCFAPLIVYSISRKHFDKNISFLAGLFFIFQSGFMNWWWIPSRQEIAFIFSGLMLLVLFTKEIDKKTRNILFFIFGFSMIVSHYSTAYITLIIFLFTYICISFYRMYESHKIRRGKISQEERVEFYLTGGIILLLLIFGFLWYSQVSDVASGPLGFVKNSFSNLGRMFEKDVQTYGTSPIDQFKIFYKTPDVASLVKEYEQSIPSNLPNTYSNTQYSLYPRYPTGIESIFNQSTNIFILSFREFLKVLGKIFVIFGVLYLFIKRKDFNKDFIILNVSYFLILSFLLILPFISIEYDVVRTYQQILILLSGSAMFGASIIFKKIPKINSEILIAIFLILYFLALSGIFQQVIGGTNISLKLNNAGFEYGSFYVKNLEIESSKWLILNAGRNNINLDGRSITKLFILSNPNISYRVIRDVLPALINKNNYVYSSYSNKINGIEYKTFNGNSLSFNFPTDFLNENKNKIYNNGGSEIFK